MKLKESLDCRFKMLLDKSDIVSSGVVCNGVLVVDKENGVELVVAIDFD